MNPGACEHASFTVTTMVISLDSIASEHIGYFGRASRGVFDSTQLRPISTSGTKSPNWLRTRQHISATIDGSSIRDASGGFMSACVLWSFDGLSLPPLPLSTDPIRARTESRYSCDAYRDDDAVTTSPQCSSAAHILVAV